MLRILALVAGLVTMLAAGGRAAADEDELSTNVDLDEERQVALAADVGMSGGGVGTPDGPRVAGHWLYRLADHDWFDSSVAFTFGGRGESCPPPAPGAAMLAAVPRRGELPAPPPPGGCQRDLGDGFAADLVLGVRRELQPRRGFTPFVRVAGFARALRFADVGGFAAGGQLGAGVRAPVTGQLSIVAGADAFLGAAWLDPDDADRQLGLTVTVGAELGMR